MQKETLSKAAFRMMTVLAICGSLVLVGCPSDDNDEQTRPVNGVNVNLNAADIAALNGETFTFTNGVGDFGTAAGTDVAFTTANGATTAQITSGGDTADTAVTFGSCIFTVGENGLGELLPPGTVVTVQPCRIQITAGNVPEGGEVDGEAVLIFGDDESEPEIVTVSIDANGRISVNGVDTGVTVSATGSTGSTGN